MRPTTSSGVSPVLSMERASGGRPQGGVVAAAVLPVPAEQILTHFLELSRNSPFLQLQPPSPASLVGVGGEKNLDLRVGEDDSADVPDRP